MCSKQNNLGAVMTCVMSPTRVLLVKEASRLHPFWKLPGGSIEAWDASVIATAIREVREETHVQLLVGEIAILSKAHHEGEVYYPHFCVAHISEEKLDTRTEITYENDNHEQPMLVRAFLREEARMMPDLLERHRRAIQKADCVE